MAINLKGPWLGIRAALPWLKRRRGTIINIGSTRATRPMPGLFPYVTSKAGLLGLTRQVAAECLETGPTCNMVAPGWVDTPGERVIQAAHGRPDFPEGVRNLTTSEELGAAVVLPRLARRPQDQRRHPLPRLPACTSPTTPGWSTCPRSPGSAIISHDRPRQESRRRERIHSTA